MLCDDDDDQNLDGEDVTAELRSRALDKTTYDKLVDEVNAMKIEKPARHAVVDDVVKTYA